MLIAVLVAMWMSLRFPGFAADALREAQSAFDQRNYLQALNILDTLVGNGLGPPRALELRLRTYLRMGRPEKAVGDYNRLANLRAGLLGQLARFPDLSPTMP
jgi:uncharacterized protein HemY